MDRAPKFCINNYNLVNLAKKQWIKLTFSKPEHTNQIFPVNIEIRKLKKCWHYKMITKSVPRRMWDFGLVHQSEIVQCIPQDNGHSGYKEVTGVMPDISEYLDFDFWDLVWYWDKCHPSLSKYDRLFAHWAGVSHHVGSDLCY